MQAVQGGRSVVMGLGSEAKKASAILQNTRNHKVVRLIGNVLGRAKRLRGDTGRTVCLSYSRNARTPETRNTAN